MKKSLRWYLGAIILAHCPFVNAPADGARSETIALTEMKKEEASNPSHEGQKPNVSRVKVDTHSSDLPFEAKDLNLDLTRIELPWFSCVTDAVTALLTTPADQKTPFSLQTLNLTSCDLKKALTHNPSFAAALQSSPTLTELDLTGNDFYTDGERWITKILKGNRNLKILRLGSTQLWNSGIRSIAQAASNHPSLTELNLSYNGIDCAGAIYIARLLEDNKTLLTLSLRGNSISFKGAKIIAAALKKNRALTSLDISMNPLQLYGFHAIAMALVNNRVIKVLNLSDTSLTQSSSVFTFFDPSYVTTLTKMVKCNSQLEELDISYNDLTIDDQKALRKAIGLPLRKLVLQEHPCRSDFTGD